MYIYNVNIHLHIQHTNLPVNAIVRIPHPRSGGSQGQPPLRGWGSLTMAFTSKFVCCMCKFIFILYIYIFII